jgi:hypothetical protein
MNHSNLSPNFPAEILERTFVIPLGVTSSSPSDLNSSFQLLPALDKIITKSELSDANHDLLCCLSCGLPSSFQNSSCHYHEEISCIFTLPHLSHFSENPSHSDSPPEPFRNDFTRGPTSGPSNGTRTQEILSSKRLSANGQCQSPFPIFDEFVLYLAGLHANSHLGPLRITQFSLKSTSPVSAPATASSSSLSASPQCSQSDCNYHPLIYLPPLYTITYQVTGTKFCHRIGRHHKSNNVMYEANLNQGFVIQKCWDPDCRGYRSPPHFIPQNSIPNLPDLHEIQEIIGDIVLMNSLSKKEL